MRGAALSAGLGLALLSACRPAETPLSNPIECGTCHDLAAITAPISDDGPREWATLAGRGLVRRPVLIQSSQDAFGFTWPARGHHPDMPNKQCVACHPISSEGIRHGLRQYPKSARAKAFGSGQDCAEVSGCHEWLVTNGTSSGFMSATLTSPTYEGSLRPADLLTGADSAHGQIFEAGFVREGGSGLRIQRLQPGCAGCHNLTDEWHGTTANCLQCHRFGEQDEGLHLSHLATIAAGRDRIDPDNASLSACSYCHGFVADATAMPEPPALAAAACYNCHLSGHQPVDASGKAHFWQ